MVECEHDWAELHVVDPCFHGNPWRFLEVCKKCGIIRVVPSWLKDKMPEEAEGVMNRGLKLEKGGIVDTPNGKLWYYNDDLQIDLVDREDGSYEVRVNMYPLKFLINAIFVEPNNLEPNQVTVCLVRRGEASG